MSEINTIVSFFRGKGLTDPQIAGILGNMRIESGFNTGATNSGEGAFGLVQWEGGRDDAERAFAASLGLAPTDVNAQLRFIWHELSTSEHGVLVALRGATTAEQAASIWDSQYERSDGTTRSKRIASANAWLSSGFKTDGGTNPTGGGAGTAGGGNETLSTNDYAQSFGDLGTLLTKIPDLNKLLQNAIATGQPVADFINTVENSAWWKSHSDSVRQALALKYTDPATFNQNHDQATAAVKNAANQLGWTLTSAQIDAIATTAVLTGNVSNQTWIAQQVGKKQDYSGLTSTDGLKGGEAATVQQLGDLAAQYGQSYTPEQAARHAKAILIGMTTIDTYKQQLIANAKSMFPLLAQQLDGGQTLTDIANPYVSTYAQLLEVDPSAVNLSNTPLVRKALRGVADPLGKAGPQLQSLSDFEDAVRRDPRWDKTGNAKQEAASTLLQLGQSFGFNG